MCAAGPAWQGPRRSPCLHHPLWSTRHLRGGEEARAEQLLGLIEDFQLQLLTVHGTTTHRWQGGESTIDLTFASEDIASHVVHWRIDHRLDHDSDHLPIDVAIDWSWQPAVPIRKRLWTQTNRDTLRQTVKDRLRNCEVTECSNKESIDELVFLIIHALDAGIAASTLWSNLSSRSISGFDKACKEICTKVQQLWRRWQRTRQEDDYETY